MQKRMQLRKQLKRLKNDTIYDYKSRTFSIAVLEIEIILAGLCKLPLDGIMELAITS